MEPILTTDEKRLSLYPIKYKSVYDMYLLHTKMFWVPDEIDFRQDCQDWNEKLTDSERHFISNILAFFATSENTVIENLALRFLHEVKLPEAQHFYAVQIFMESVHSDTYSRMIDILLNSCSNDPVIVAREKAKLFGAVETIETIKKKAEWAKRWIFDNDSSFAERLLAFISVEGIAFIGSFAAIYWLKKRGIMPGLTFSNELIQKDESLHRDFGILLYKLLRNPAAPERVLEIVTSAVELEIAFVEEALPVNLIGMNATDMSDYIRYTGDFLLAELGLPTHYKAKNPFPFMAAQGAEAKTNFFERRVSEYGKAHATEKKFTTSLSVFEEA